jgi:BASS family bile acid:Na+ symporter
VRFSRRKHWIARGVFPWNVRGVKPGLGRTAAILLALVLGTLLPQAQAAIGVVRFLVMFMLFLVFLQTRLSRSALHRSHLVLLAVNLLIGFGAFGLGWAVGGRDIALAAFFCGITPTAIAAPVIIGFMRGRVDYVVAAFLVTNVVISALLPVILPLVLGQTAPASFAQVFRTMGLVVFTPMLTAWVLRALYPPAATWPNRLRNVTFGIWVVALFLVTANASAFLHQHGEVPTMVLVQISVTSLVVCIAGFALGRVVGGREYRREASQALGQKNTTFTIYLALTYAGPLVALGPTCYVLWHNLWNSWQLHRVGRDDPK